MIYTDRIKEAIYFTSNAHKGQTRILLEYPYIVHPFSVLFIVSHFTNDEDTLIASILHDVAEDTKKTLDDIENNFGKKVRDIVDVLTEDESLLNREEKKKKQLERFKNASHEILLIKLADIIQNFCDTMLILEKYPKEDYLKSFGGNIKEKIRSAEERIDIIEETWKENPLLSETKSRFEDYKKLLEKLELLDL